MTREVKKKLVQKYDEDIRIPLLKYKVQDFSALEERADYTNVVAIEDFGDAQMEEIQRQILEEENEENGITHMHVDKRISELESVLVSIFKKQE